MLTRNSVAYQLGPSQHQLDPARPKLGVAELYLGSCLNAILNLLLNLEANGLWYIRPHGSLCVVLCHQVRPILEEQVRLAQFVNVVFQAP